MTFSAAFPAPAERRRTPPPPGLAEGRRNTPFRHLLRRLPFTVAAPSFVWPAGYRENCLALAPHVEEVGLLFFESASSLALAETDLPSAGDLSDLRCHVHLPLDLYWGDGGDAAAGTTAALLEKILHLCPRAAVLHPPADPGMLSNFCGRLSGLVLTAPNLLPELLIENLDPEGFISLWPRIEDLGLHVCLDLAHLLAAPSSGILALPGLWERVRMVHLSAPADGDRHLSLDMLSPEQERLVLDWLRRVPADAVCMVEVFSPRSLFASLEWLLEREEALR